MYCKHFTGRYQVCGKYHKRRAGQRMDDRAAMPPLQFSALFGMMLLLQILC
jgi:hypothetical protein